MSYEKKRGAPRRKQLRRRPQEIGRRREQKEARRRARNRRGDARSFRSMVRRSSATMHTMMVQTFLDDVLPGDIHAKRVESIVGGVQGVLASGSLAVSAIGRGYAAYNDGMPKHGIKQVDRMLSNGAIDLDAFFGHWIAFVVGDQQSITVALDWTEFDRDGQSTLAATVVSGPDCGRGRLLFWESFKADELIDGGRTDAENAVLMALRAHLPEGVQVVILADRGFGDQPLYTMLACWSWDFVIRFRGGIEVTDADGERKPAVEWLSAGGRARKVVDAKVTQAQVPVGAIVAVRAAQMKEPWFLATSLRDETASQIVKLYGRRFTIEETFRDLKDPRYGLGLKGCRVGRTDRRDRLILLFAITHSMLSLLDEASERVGYDKSLKANTTSKRTHSLFSQGAYYFGAIPNMSADRLWTLMEAFVDIFHQHRVFLILTSEKTRNSTKIK